MSDPYVDTDVIIRLVTGDDPAKQGAAQALFRQVQDGTLIVRAPATVIADAVYVLSSPRLYGRARAQVRTDLVPLLRLPGFRVQPRRLLLRALDIYAATALDFGDAMIVATMERAGATTIYSYDHDFDRIPAITRSEP
jgi:predicted nucleic acid-binding protein